ncbi:MAG TPA: hypothetical protein EYP10_00045, partial [Armatimonadetes bacterium]|nr:hypothetical protein [Armatimonadota bacterium]
MRSRSDKCIWILMRALVAIAIIVCAFIAGCERNRRVAESKVDVAELVQRTARTEQLIELSKVRDAPVYNASLTLSDSLDQFDATVRITYTNRANKPLSDMVLHVYPNSRFMVEGDEPNIRIEEILVDNRRADYKADHAILRITLPRELAPNKRTVVTVRYRARVPHLRRHPSDLIGMLTDAFQDLMSGKRQRPRNLGIFATADGLVSLGLWYPVVAIYGDDGWDTLEPSPIGDFFNSEISHFNVRITTPRDVMVVTTGIDGLPRAMGDGEYEYFYNTAGAVRDFSIQCSRKFEAVSTIAHCGSGTPVRVTCYFLPNHRAPALHALKIAAAS